MVVLWHKYLNIYVTDSYMYFNPYDYNEAVLPDINPLPQGFC